MERVKELFASWKGKHQEDFYLKSFKDAGYDYTVLIKFNSLLEDEVQCGITIVVDARVGEVGMDLVKYAMGHIIEEVGDQIKILEKEIEIEWALISVLLANMDYVGSILDIIGSVPDNMMSFQELNKSILNSKDTPLNLNKLKENAELKKNKVAKVLDYITQTYSDDEVQKVSYDITSKLEKVDNTIRSNVTITFTVLYTFPGQLDYFITNESKAFKARVEQDLINQVHESSPVELTKKDNIIFKFIRAK